MLIFKTNLNQLNELRKEYFHQLMEINWSPQKNPWQRKLFVLFVFWATLFFPPTILFFKTCKSVKIGYWFCHIENTILACRPVMRMRGFGLSQFAESLCWPLEMPPLHSIAVCREKCTYGFDAFLPDVRRESTLRFPLRKSLKIDKVCGP